MEVKNIKKLMNLTNDSNKLFWQCIKRMYAMPIKKSTISQIINI